MADKKLIMDDASMEILRKKILGWFEDGTWELPESMVEGAEKAATAMAEKLIQENHELNKKEIAELAQGSKPEKTSETPYTDIARHAYAKHSGSKDVMEYLEAKDHIVGTDAQGGYLAPTTDDNMLIDLTIRDSVMMGISNTKFSKTNVLTMPTLTQAGGINGYWVAESTDADGGTTKTTEETLVFGQITLTLYALRSNSIVSNEALEDTSDFGIGIEKTITDDLTSGFGAAVDFGVLHGNATAGEANSSSLLTGLEGASGLISSNVFNTDGGFNYSHMVQLMTPEDNSRGALAYVMAPAARRQLIDMKDSTGKPIFEGGLATGGIPSVLGIPIHLNRNVKKTLGAGSETAIFSGSFGQDAIIGVKRGISILVNPYRFADYAATQITGFMRVGFTVTAENRFGILGGVPTV